MLIASALGHDLLRLPVFLWGPNCSLLPFLLCGYLPTSASSSQPLGLICLFVPKPASDLPVSLLGFQPPRLGGTLCLCLSEPVVFPDLSCHAHVQAGREAQKLGAVSPVVPRCLILADKQDTILHSWCP